ncbi:MAG: hypothetical protein K2Y08_02960 [Alphaproteobacteria bacterium]|nr:hypothetical protein [Alphaproteobacteria bacterium]
MSIFRKIKLALFSSGFILASYNASAMIEVEEREKKILPKGLPVEEPLPADSIETALSQRVVDELSARLARLAILKSSEGDNAMPSSSVPNTDTLNNSEEGVVASSSSFPTLEISPIHKKALNDIAGRLAPIGSALKTFLASPPTSPQTRRKSVNSFTSPRERRKSSKVRGRKDTLEISSPSSNNMTITSVEDYQEELPNCLREFSEKLQAVNYKGLPRDRQKEFYELLCSFGDVEKIYQDHINSKYRSTLEYLQIDLRNIIEVETTRRFHVIRQATADFIKEEAAKAAATRKAAEEAAHQVGGEPPSGAEEFPLSRGSSLSSIPSSPPLSPRGNRSFPSSPPPALPGLSKNGSSSSVPLLLLLQKEGPSSPRPLPVPPPEKNPSSSISVSPPSSSTPPHPPHRSRSISTPVKKMKPAAAFPPTSPPPNKRWAHYSKSPVDLSGQYDESDQSD